MDLTQKSALFNVYQGITLYLVPITAKTRDFCNEMGVDTDLFKNAKHFTETTASAKAQDDIRALEEETHCYAVFSQIKQAFN